MALKLVFLGRLEDAAGHGERIVPFAPDLAAVLAALEPTLADALDAPRIRTAINGVLVIDPSLAVLNEGDEIAFLPPVSGG